MKSVDKAHILSLTFRLNLIAGKRKALVRHQGNRLGRWVPDPMGLLVCLGITF